MTSTDYLQLNGNRLFEEIRQTLPKISKAQNLLTVKDDVLYTWDFQNNCVLTLNVKAARNLKDCDVRHQTLLPTRPPLFVPEDLFVNDNNTLLVVAGLHGVLVFELPERCSPYGAFANNKEMVYCRSYSLHERLFAFSNDLEVRKVRFHPGSPKNNHILILTSDNTLRLCKIENTNAYTLGNFEIGEVQAKKFSGTKVNLLEEMGESTVDFDFAPPIPKDLNTNSIKLNNYGGKDNTSLDWPLLLLHGDGCVYTTMFDYEQKGTLKVMGPLPHSPDLPESTYFKDYCAIMCIPSTPPIVCIAQCNGTISHSLLLDAVVDREEQEIDEHHPYKYYVPNRALYLFETIEIELGLSTVETESEYCCPIFFYKDLSRLGNYYAIHETGVHSIRMHCVEDLHKFVTAEEDETVDLLKDPSSAEYLVCTKTSSNQSINPIIGFSLNYDPMSLLALLGNGQLVTLAVISLPLLPSAEEMKKEHLEKMNTPLKQMLNNPFDAHIQKILKKVSSNPIIKLSSSQAYTVQERYELLQRASNILHEEHFKKISTAQEEIEKRVKSLRMLKAYQLAEVERMRQDKSLLSEKAESLAERYEDIKDKQEELTKRCEKILLLLSRKQQEPSNAEKQFIKELKAVEEKVEHTQKGITMLKKKVKYQEMQMQNWKRSNEKEQVLEEVQSTTIKANLQDMTNKITNIIKEIHECKDILNL